MDAVTLQGKHVRLEPLSRSHRDGLCDAIRDGELWKLHVTFVPHPDQINEFLIEAEQAAKDKTGLAFATIDRASGKIVGSTRFMHASPINRRIEIGFTFLAKTYQRTVINTEAKFLMLSHAFDELDFNRVEFLTDYLNVASRNAIVRLGAKQEGVLRSHIVMPNGRIRDSVVYSIIKGEWPGVKQHLEALLN